MNAVSARTAITSKPTVDVPTSEKLAWAATFAVLAPSKHNTQPWLFEVGHDAIDIHADGSRALPASDPYGREMLISCGAALANLQLAVRALGYEPLVNLFPQGAAFSHLARVRLGPSAVITEAEQALLEAIPRRHTQRLPLDGTVLSEVLVADLEMAASREGARLTFVTRRRAERVVAHLVEQADRLEADDAERRAEAAAWVRRSDDMAADGIPADNAGVGSRRHRMRYVTRNFRGRRHLGDPGRRDRGHTHARAALDLRR